MSARKHWLLFFRVFVDFFFFVRPMIPGIGLIMIQLVISTLAPLLSCTFDFSQKKSDLPDGRAAFVPRGGEAHREGGQAEAGQGHRRPQGSSAVYTTRSIRFVGFPRWITSLYSFTDIFFSDDLVRPLFINSGFERSVRSTALALF